MSKIFSVATEIRGKDALSSKLRGVGRVAGATSHRMRSLAASGVLAGRGLGRLGSVVGKLTGLLGGVGIAAGLTTSVAAAAGFGKKMAEVSTLLDPSQDLAPYTSAVRTLAKEFGIMHDEVAGGQYASISAGFTAVADSTAVLTSGLRLAKGGAAETGTAIAGLTGLLNAYGIGADRATDVSDAMFVAMRMGQTTISELSEHIGKAAPLAKQLGVSYDELLGSTAALTLGGLKTAEAVTGMRGVFKAVVKPTSEARDTAKRLGIAFSEAAVRSQGLQSWLGAVQEKLDKSHTPASRLFGDIEGLTAVLALGSSGGAKFNSVMTQMAMRSGATDQAVARMTGNMADRFDKLRVVVNDAAISIGNSLEPVLTPLAGRLASVASYVGQWAEKNRDLIESKTIDFINGFATAVSQLDLGNTASAVNQLAGGFMSIAETFAVINRLLRVAKGLVKVVLGPIGAVVMGVGALAGSPFASASDIVNGPTRVDKLRAAWETGRQTMMSGLGDIATEPTPYRLIDTSPDRTSLADRLTERQAVKLDLNITAPYWMGVTQSETSSTGVVTDFAITRSGRRTAGTGH